MKLYFRQRAFSWFDSYDIYGQDGSVLYTVKGQLSWGHCLAVFDARGNRLGTVKERVLTFLPQFELYEGNNYVGCIRKEFTFFKPVFTIDCSGWEIDGSWMEWDYAIQNRNGGLVARISRELFHWTDTYVIDVADPRDALRTLMVVLAIDAEKCSRN